MMTTSQQRTFRIRGNRVTLTVKGKRTTYEFRVFGVDHEMGTAGVSLRKIDGLTYDVLVGPMPSCECLGHLRWSCKCKHIQLAEKLVEKASTTASAGSPK